VSAGLLPVPPSLDGPCVLVFTVLSCHVTPPSGSGREVVRRFSPNHAARAGFVITEVCDPRAALERVVGRPVRGPHAQSARALLLGGSRIETLYSTRLDTHRAWSKAAQGE